MLPFVFMKGAYCQCQIPCTNRAKTTNPEGLIPKSVPGVAELITHAPYTSTLEIGFLPHNSLDTDGRRNRSAI